MNYNSQTTAEKIQAEMNRKAEAEQRELDFYNQTFLNACEKEDIKIILQLIKDLSLWDMVNENINPDILAYQRGRRDMWMIIRRHIPKDVLAQIEIFNKYRIDKRQKEI